MVAPSGTMLKRSEDVACRKIGDETLLVPIRRTPEQKFGVFTLNPSASWIWEHIDGSRSIDQLAQALTQRFKVSLEQARADVQTLCNELISIGAVAATDGGQGGDA